MKWEPTMAETKRLVHRLSEVLGKQIDGTKGAGLTDEERAELDLEVNEVRNLTYIHDNPPELIANYDEGEMKRGSWVAPLGGFHFGCATMEYDSAVVLSMEPFVLASIADKGAMRWSQRKPEEFRVLGEVTDYCLSVLDRRRYG